MPALAGTLLLVAAGCSTLPTGEESATGELPADETEVAVPELVGPRPPSAAVLEQFDAAVAALQAEDYPAAQELLEGVLQESTEFVGVYVNLGIARLRQDDQAGATTAFEQALALQPGHPVVLNQLAIQERRGGRFEEARSLYRRALDSRPDYPPLHLNMGILCDLYLRQADCALSHYARYVELGGAQAEQVSLWIVDLERRMGAAPMSTGNRPARPPQGKRRIRAAGTVLLLVMAGSPAFAQDVIELESISIIGNPELPKTITLVPWKRALPGDLAGEPEGSLLRDELTAIDPPVFRRELRYYEAGFAIE